MTDTYLPHWLTYKNGAPRVFFWGLKNFGDWRFEDLVSKFQRFEDSIVLSFFTSDIWYSGLRIIIWDYLFFLFRDIINHMRFYVPNIGALVCS